MALSHPPPSSTTPAREEGALSSVGKCAAYQDDVPGRAEKHRDLDDTSCAVAETPCNAGWCMRECKCRPTNCRRPVNFTPIACFGTFTHVWSFLTYYGSITEAKLGGFGGIPAKRPAKRLISSATYWPPNEGWIRIGGPSNQGKWQSQSNNSLMRVYSRSIEVSSCLLAEHRPSLSMASRIAYQLLSDEPSKSLPFTAEANGFVVSSPRVFSKAASRHRRDAPYLRFQLLGTHLYATLHPPCPCNQPGIPSCCLVVPDR